MSETRESEAERTVMSIAAMLGWLNVPPRHVLEADIAALKVGQLISARTRAAEGSAVHESDKPASLREERLQEITERAKRATAGPWHFQVIAKGQKPDGSVMIGAVAPGHQIRANPPGGSYPSNDGEFMAHARQDIPDLLAALREAAQALQHLAAPVALPEEPPVVSCGHGGGDLCPACVGVLVRDYHALRARLAQALQAFQSSAAARDQQVSGLIEQMCQHVRSHGVSWNPDGASDHEGHPIHLWDPDGEPMSDHPWIHGQVLMRKACAVTVAAYADRISALLKTGPETPAAPTTGTT